MSNANKVSPFDVPGIFLPPDWGTFWKPKRNASGLASISLVGDSIGSGYYASNPNTKGWFGALVAALQAQYGDGGSGFKKTADSNAGMTNIGVAAAAIASYAGKGVLIGVSAGWAFARALAGPGGCNFNSTAAGSTLTFTVRGTSVTIFYVTTPANTSPFNWSIDGNAQAAVNSQAANGMGSVTVNGLTAGNHTVVVTAPGVNPVYICGVSGVNTKGVVGHDYSLFQYGSSATYNNTDGFGGIGKWSGGISNPSDLVIYEAFGDDAASGTVTGDVWETNARRYLSGVKEGTNGQTDILIIAPHIGTFDENVGTAYIFQEYCDRALGLAQSYGAAFVNFWRLGRNSWNYWQGLGYMSVEDGTGGPGNSPGHPSDAGHAYMASRLLPILTA